MATISQQAITLAREYLAIVGSKVHIEKALVFGSVARGTASKDSDIDLVILSEDFKSMELKDRLIMLSRLRGNKFISWPMDILGYTTKEFEKLSKISPLFKDVKKEAIIIQ